MADVGTGNRDIDIVVYGASGFTGRQALHYLGKHAPAELRLAAAGRSRERLEASVAGLAGRPCAVVLADSAEPASVAAMAARARVVVTTAGPYTRYGDPVVAACVEHGADYVDITGETPWVRKQIDLHHEAAKRKGVRIVPLCGFDSIPSDLGVYLLALAARERTGTGLRSVRSLFRMKGGVNGGSVASGLAMAETGGRALLDDPLLLAPGAAGLDAPKDCGCPAWDADLQSYSTAFVMSRINSRVVLRSAMLHAAEGEPYGASFRYEERMEAKSYVQALVLGHGLDVIDLMARTRPGRSLMRAIAPKPGAGPSEEAMDAGYFRCRMVAETESGAKLRLTVKGQGDPGNRCTVRMLCESALLLACERERLPARFPGGLLTPATALGEPLADRLRRAGMTLEVAAD